jgi:acyl carrier protein
MDYMFEKVKALLVGKFGVPAEQISEDATFEELDLDSLDLVEFAMAAQDEFGAKVTDEEAETLRTVGEAVTLLSSKLAGSEA